MSHVRLFSLTDITPLMIKKETVIKVKEARLVPMIADNPALNPCLMLELIINKVTGPGVPKNSIMVAIYVPIK